MEKTLRNTQQQMRKGLLELCVLSIVAEGEVYPSDIITRLKAAELIVVEGTLYPLLTRLKNGGLLQFVWRETSSGPPRKYYTLTAAGRDFLHQLLGTWQQLQHAVQHSTQPHSTSQS